MASSIPNRKIQKGKFSVYTDKESEKEIAECGICGAKLKYHQSTTMLQYHLDKEDIHLQVIMTMLINQIVRRNPSKEL
jgi:hypothetical protein